MASVIYTVLSSRITLLFTFFVFCWSAFYFMSKILRGKKTPAPWMLPLFSGLNAVAFLLASYITDVPLSAIMMAVVPTVLLPEIALVSRDRWWPYLNLYFASLLTLLCAHSFACAIITLGLRDLWHQGTMEHRYAIFSLTMALAALVFWGLLRSRFTSVSVLSELMHSTSRGMLLFVYFILSSVVLLISTQSVQDLVFNDHLPREIEVAMYTDFVLKDGLILTCSFLIVAVQLWQDQSAQRSRELHLNLQKERGYRASRQKSALLSYCANITKNQVEDGLEFFSDQLNHESDGYVEMLKQFTLHCVHQGDWKLLFDLGSPAYYREKLASNPSYTLRMRVAPKRMLEVSYPPEAVREKLLSSEKEWLWVEFQATVTQDDDSGDILVYVALTDIDNAVEQETALLQAASIDALTGALNRAALRQAIQQSLSHSDASGALFLMDMDHFKDVNDTLGHPAGDALLQKTVDMLRTIFRDGDLVGRLGGDEFCVFAPGLRNPERILRIAADLNRHGRQTHTGKDGGQFQTSLSIGVAVCPDHGATSDALYKCADVALYQAKEAGRDTFRVYSPDMRPPEGAEAAETEPVPK